MQMAFKPDFQVSSKWFNLYEGEECYRLKTFFYNHCSSQEDVK